MIRPVTLATAALAVGAGLWLYQAKHNAQLADREIARLYRQVDQTKDRIGILRAEWALLNMPDRLREIATRHLSLQMVQPTQWTTVAELARHLPPIAPAQAAPSQVEPVPEPDTPPVPIARAPDRPTAVAAAEVPRPVERPSAAVTPTSGPASPRGIEATPLAPPAGVRAAPPRPVSTPSPAPPAAARQAPAPAVAAAPAAAPAPRPPARPVAPPAPSPSYVATRGGALPPPVPRSGASTSGSMLGGSVVAPARPLPPPQPRSAFPPVQADMTGGGG